MLAVEEVDRRVHASRLSLGGLQVIPDFRFSESVSCVLPNTKG